MSNKTALARRPSAPAPKGAPSAAQQAARERFAAMARAKQQNASPAPVVASSAKAPSRPLAPRAKVVKETLGSIVGSTLPTAAAGFGLGMLNGSEFGKNVSQKFLLGFDASRVVGIAAAGAKLIGVDGFSPALGRACTEIAKSELVDVSRAAGRSLSEKVSETLKKESKTEKTETKPEEKTGEVQAEVVSSKPVETTPVNGRSRAAA